MSASDPSGRTCVIVCADRHVFDLLIGFLLSVRGLDKARFAVKLIDAGLTSAQRDYAADLCDGVAPIDERLLAPLNPQTAAMIEAKSPFWRAQSCRPYLPDYFPGYRHYIHMDADMWVQNLDVFDAVVSAMDAGEVAIAPEVDVAYAHIGQLNANRDYFNVKRQVTRQIFGDAIADQLAAVHHFNTGFFGMAADAPHWAMFRQYLTEAQKVGYHHLMEQITFGIVLLNLGRGRFMPAVCNWMCNQATPIRKADGVWRSPVFPHEEIRVLHLTGTDKIARYQPLGLLYDEGRYLADIAALS